MHYTLIKYAQSRRWHEKCSKLYEIFGIDYLSFCSGRFNVQMPLVLIHIQNYFKNPSL